VTSFECQGRVVAVALALASVAGIAPADAQTPPKTARVGFLGISAAFEAKEVAALRQRLVAFAHVCHGAEHCDVGELPVAA
jgi:hypothetical protein